MNQGRPMLYAACLGCLALIVGLLAVSGGSAEAQDAKNDPAPQVVLETNKGNITVELDRVKAPISVDNFLKYVDSGHYNGTIFHRVIPGFMIQGGGMGKDNREKKAGNGIKNEGGNGLRNVRGTLAMARTPNPDSATAQFFINLADNDFLDRDKCPDGYGYAVFGKVVDGVEVIDEIAKVRTVRNAVSEGYPTETIIINTAKRKPKS